MEPSESECLRHLSTLAAHVFTLGGYSTVIPSLRLQ